MYGRVNMMVFELPFLPMLEAWLPVVRDRCMTNDHKTSDWQARDMARVLCIMFQIFIKKKVSRFRFGQNYKNPERSKNLCYSVIPSLKPLKWGQITQRCPAFLNTAVQLSSVREKHKVSCLHHVSQQCRKICKKSVR